MELSVRYEELDRVMTKYMEHIDRKFDHIDSKFDHIDRKFDQIDKQFEHIDRRFSQIDIRYNWIIGLIITVGIALGGILLKLH